MDNNLNEYDNGSGNRGGNGGNGNRGNNNGKNNQTGRSGGWMIIIFILLLVAFGFLIYNMFFSGGKNYKEKEYTEFLKDLEADKVESVELNAEKAVMTVTLKTEAVTDGDAAKEAATGTLFEQQAYAYRLENERVYQTYVMDTFEMLLPRLVDHGVVGKRVVSNNSGLFTEILVGVILPVALLWIIAMFFMRRMGGSGGPLGVGKSNAKVYVQKETGVTFADVAGEDEAKESLVEVVDFLHDPSKYTKIGARLPKGALLVGPPGTGKTLLAKAVAGEAHVPFFSLTGSDFIELYVGVGASRVRDLFKEANKNAPCIIFIDEIDAIGRSRDSRYGGGNEEREQTLNQLLSEMDGFDTSKGILILGATNRPEILDKALLRPGRFDRRIIVDKPDLKGRVEILKVHAKDVKMDETVDLDAIALATSGAVGSDLANMINEAAINAVKENRQYVNQQDLFAAVEQVLVGKEKKDRIMSPEERKIVSYHEVGHALISALQKNADPVQKITIVPRTMGALGYVMNVPEEEKYLNSEAELRDRIVSLLGGRAAEEIMFDSVTTGAANDIEKATELVRDMITRYGMSKKFGLMSLATVESRYLEGRTELNCSDRTAALIDEEISAVLKESYDKALSMLRENIDIMDKIAAFLIEKETITGKEFMQIFRKEKGLPDPEEEKKEEETCGEDLKSDDAKVEDTNAEVEMNTEVKSDNIDDITIGDSNTDSQDASDGSNAADTSDEQKPSDNDASENPGEKWQAPPDPNDGKPRGRFSNSQM